MSTDLVEKRRSQLRTTALKKSKLPVRHAIKMMDDLLKHPKWKEAKEDLAQILTGKGIAILIGPRGTGKTQLAVSAAVNMIENALHKSDPCVACYYKARELGQLVRDAFGQKDRAESESFKQFVKPELLIIDEVKERLGTEFEQRVLTSIIDERYDQLLSTILITNAKPDDLPQLLGPSIIDRTREGGGVIEMDWHTMRGAS